MRTLHEGIYSQSRRAPARRPCAAGHVRCGRDLVLKGRERHANDVERRWIDQVREVARESIMHDICS